MAQTTSITRTSEMKKRFIFGVQSPRGSGRQEPERSHITPQNQHALGGILPEAVRDATHANRFCLPELLTYRAYSEAASFQGLTTWTAVAIMAAMAMPSCRS